MGKKPITDDWVYVSENTEYSEKLDLYYYNGRVYDELSARHNGLIGLGYTLRKAVKEANKW